MLPRFLVKLFVLFLVTQTLSGMAPDFTEANESTRAGRLSGSDDLDMDTELSFNARVGIWWDVGDPLFFKALYRST